MRLGVAMRMLEEHYSRLEREEQEYRAHEQECEACEEKGRRLNMDDLRDGLKDCLVDMMRIVHVRRRTDSSDFVFLASPVPADKKSVFDRAAGAIDLALGLGVRFGGGHCFIACESSDTCELKNVLRQYESRDISFEECRRRITEILEEECT